MRTTPHYTTTPRNNASLQLFLKESHTQNTYRSQSCTALQTSDMQHEQMQHALQQSGAYTHQTDTGILDFEFELTQDLGTSSNNMDRSLHNVEHPCHSLKDCHNGYKIYDALLWPPLQIIGTVLRSTTNTVILLNKAKVSSMTNGMDINFRYNRLACFLSLTDHCCLQLRIHVLEL